MFQKMLENVRGKCPLIHNITNYVTVNDCANIVLACGASPIMSDDQSEVEEITTICGGLNINIGTLNKRTIESMLLAGKRANELSHPVVLDPVGAGASKLRTETAQKLLEEVKFTVIRGNISEVKTLASGSGTTKGVDADVADKVSEENLDSAVAFAKAFAEKTGAVIAITGAIDIVADGQKGLLHPKRPPHDVLHHGHGLPALRHDGGVCDGEPRASAGGCRGGGLRHGPCRRDRARAPFRAGWQLHLSQLHHRRHLQHDARTAGERRKV